MLGSTASIVIFYCLCSGGMLVVNKLTIHHIAAPAFVTLVQFAATVLAVVGGWSFRWISLDQVKLWRLRYFAVYVLAFSAGTWSNMMVLMHANVETVIVFRSCAPLCVSIMDYIFYGRALPSRRSMSAMGLIVVGTVIYVAVDKELRSPSAAKAYTWVGVWFSLLIFQLTYAKKLVSGLGLNSIWSPVLYTNALALFPTALIGGLSGDFTSVKTVTWTTPACSWLLLSCVTGLGISWTGFKCQQVLTATAYTVVGVMNKLLTVLLNVLIWDQHASPAGIAALCVCLGGGALYQQAPLRKANDDEVVKAESKPLMAISKDGGNHCKASGTSSDREDKV